MAPPTKTVQCPECKKNICKNKPSVGCGYCDKYFHLPCCHVNEEQYKFLLKFRNFKFTCKNCEESPLYFKLQTDMRNGFMELAKSMETKMDEYKQALDEHFQNSLLKLKDDFNQFVDSVRCDQSSELENLKAEVNIVKSEISHCYAMVKQVDQTAYGKICALETKNSILQRRLNRADIVITGLPQSIKHLRTPVKKIASLCKIQITDADIQHCTYFANGKSVLVKFNSVFTRDLIMGNYIKLADPILTKDIVCGEVRKEIHLGDHHTPAASQLLFICRKLRSAKKIQKYTFINTDVPAVKVTLNNNSVKKMYIQECTDLLNGLYNPSGVDMDSGQNI